MTVEAPLLRLGFGFAEAGLDQAVGRLEVLIDKEAGGDQRLPDGVDVLAGFFFGEVGGEAEGIHTTSKKRGEGVFVFATGQSAHDGAGAGALDQAAGGDGAITQRAQHGETLVIAGLLRFFRRHLFQRELVDDVLGVNELHFGFQRQGEGLVIAVAFLHGGIVALQAVAADELVDEFLGREVGGEGWFFRRGRWRRGRWRRGLLVSGRRRAGWLRFGGGSRRGCRLDRGSL